MGEILGQHPLLLMFLSAAFGGITGGGIIGGLGKIVWSQLTGWIRNIEKVGQENRADIRMLVEKPTCQSDRAQCVASFTKAIDRLTEVTDLIRRDQVKSLEERARRTP